MATCPKCTVKYADNVDKCPVDGEALLPDAIAASIDQDLKQGDLVGEYIVDTKIGEGGFGKVYAAHHPVIGKRAAIKVLNREYSSNLGVVSRFVSEAKAVNQIRHRNIIDIFSFSSLPDGRQYLVMELLDGLTMDAYLDQHGRMTPEEALPVLRQLGRALDAAHAAGIAHRDLKPENVFLTFDDEGTCFPKLLDFGIAKLLGDGSATHKTRTGAAMGTPLYMSPEQCRGRNVDHRTDIYSFGVMTHQVLTGKLPFDGDSMMDLMFKHAQSPPPPMSTACADIPAALDAGVMHMLAKEPGERPATLSAAIEALEDAARAAGFNIAKRSTLGDGKKSGGLAEKSRQITGGGKTTSGEADTVAVSPLDHSGSAPVATLNTVETHSRPASNGNARTFLIAAAVLVAIGAASLFALQGGDAPATGSPETAPQTTAPTTTEATTTTETTTVATTAEPPPSADAPPPASSPSQRVPAPPPIAKTQPSSADTVSPPTPKPPPKGEKLPDDLASPF